jgi:hypothetical protein
VPNDLAEWLADAAAFDAAGADTLWLDLATEPDLEPLALTAALAATTSRSLLVTRLPAPDEASPTRSRALATIQRLSRGRLRIVADAESEGGPGAVGPVLGIFRRVVDNPETYEHTHPDGPQRWVMSPLPDGRATWRAAQLDAAERQVHGLVVPADPRLLDLLRNPEDLGGRSDLQLAVG